MCESYRYFCSFKESNNTDVGSMDRKQYDSQLATFWENLNSLVHTAPHGHHLHNVARYDIFVGDLRLYNEYMFLFFSFCCFNTLVLLTFVSVSSLKYLKLNVNIS